MNILQELGAEHSKAQALKIAAYACASKKNFRELMKCFLSDDYRIAQRAAWSVSWAARQQPGMIVPYIKELVAQMQRKDVHNAVVRNSVRILEAIEIPEEFHGEVMNVCFAFIESPATPVAVKAFALTTLFNLSKKYPDIRAELKLVIEERWDMETAAFRSRGRKILKAIE
ncbi:hypothetical protein GWC95_09500 [Sediminibacterium roseum]|uniref:HEAT repeat-containing protein n=1 Tax=Sediminibacterium roseum TaxID=1978412 RepID=A0ABW9ZWR7_9BACT|nr:hypothetical protein [Sediminibacterium roseum]NCI50157.1 hypothetical protein [Sediminibacterium roseum]